MEINIEGSGDRNAYFDLWADDTNTDYSARLIRAPGVNGELRLRNKGTGLIALGTNNSDDMVIADGGDVGIGTSAPTAKLDVRGSAVFNDGSIDADFRIESNNNTNAFQINGGTDDVIVNGDGSSETDFRVEGGTDENMLFVDASADRVGIGTNLPTATLDVNPGRVEFQGVGATDASEVIGTGILEIGNGLRLDANELITNTDATLFVNNTNNGDVVVDSNTLFVDASANEVGIGTTAPTAKLDVRGSAVFNEASADADFRIESNNNTNAFMVNGGNDDVVVNENSSSFTDFRVESNTNANMLFVDSNVNRVGIGTSSPPIRWTSRVWRFGLM